MSKFVDANVTPGSPVFGIAADSRSRLQVYALGNGVALAETIFPALNSSVPGPAQDKAVEAMWLNFTMDNGNGRGIAFYLITTEIGDPSTNPGALAAPNPIAAVAPAFDVEGQCIFVPVGGEYHRKFGRNQAFRAIRFGGGETGFLRVEGTSEGG